MQAQPMCIVYEALNTGNGKRYIGATEKGLRARRRKHLANAKRGQDGKFYTAIRKYGPQTFVFSVLIECRDFWHALDEERRLIGELKPEYNLTEGGGGVKGFQFSTDSRRKMSAAARRRWDSRPPELLATYKINQPRLSPEERRASYMAVGRKLAELVSRKVRCINDGSSHASCAAAGRAFGVSTASIVLYCQKKVKAKSGLLFEYEGAARV